MEDLLTFRLLLRIVVFIVLGIVGSRAARLFEFRSWVSEKSRVWVMLSTVFLDIDLPLIILFGVPMFVALAAESQYSLMHWAILYSEMPEIAIGLLVPGILGLMMGLGKMFYFIFSFQTPAPTT